MSLIVICININSMVDICLDIKYYESISSACILASVF